MKSTCAEKDISSRFSRACICPRKPALAPSVARRSFTERERPGRASSRRSLERSSRTRLLAAYLLIARYLSGETTKTDKGFARSSAGPGEYDVTDTTHKPHLVPTRSRASGTFGS